jgi:hypothetical protein
MPKFLQPRDEASSTGSAPGERLAIRISLSKFSDTTDLEHGEEERG